MGPSDVVLYAGLLLTVLNIIDRIAIIKDKTQAPHQVHEKRITDLELEVSNIKKYLDNDDKRIKSLERGGKVLLRSIGALLSHSIDGNNTDEMKLAREELNEYLIQR